MPGQRPVEGPPADAPPLPRRVIFDQHWCELIFLHWPVDPAAVTRFMPPGVRPDVWQDGASSGMTYVGLVPFRMSRAGVGTGPAIPWFGSFLEWNVRLYSVDDAGRHGVVFRSLDTTRLPVAALAAALGVPYRWARIRTGGGNGDVWWRMRRRSPSRPHSELCLTVGARVDPTPLELFLISRWGMHSRAGARAVWVPNQHERWDLHAAELTRFDDDLIAAAGVPVAGPMLRPLWTPGVHARFSTPRLLPRPTGS